MGEEGDQDAAFDVAEAVAAFVADDAATALELPWTLTAEQRKQAKRLVDQHKGLKCESFGFGGERRLHLFKQAGQLGTVSEDREPCSPVRVKNTFIDDFVDRDAEGTAEHLHFRSLPNRLGSQRMWEEEHRAAPVVNMAALPTEPPPPSPPAVVAAMSEASNVSAAGSSSSLRASELPGLPETFKFTVRDTFIHVEEAQSSASERAVQSMPDGMFQAHLQAELRERSAAQPAPTRQQPTQPPIAAPTSPPPTTAPPSPPPSQAPSSLARSFAPGTEVTIEGLMKLPAFNGRSGTVESFDEAQGRYNVLLDSPATAGGSRWAKVKAENLRPSLPPPPHHAPMLTTTPPALLEETFYYAPPPQSIPPTPQWEDGYKMAGDYSSPPFR